MSADEPSPKRRIGKRQFPAAARRLEQVHEIERRVGRGPLGEKSLEGVEIRAIIRTVSRIIFDPACRLQPPARATAAFAWQSEMQR